MTAFKKGDKVIVTGPTNGGTEWILPRGELAIVTDEEQYGHVRIDSIKFPKQYAPFWSYPVDSVERAEVRS